MGETSTSGPAGLSESYRLHGPLAVRARRMFDGARRVDRPVMVLIEDGRISDVDLTGAAAPDHWRVIDLGDVTLLPGLIDAHSHLSFDPHGRVEDQMLSDSDDVVLERMTIHAQQALRVGVTTIRDLGDRGHLGVRLREMFARTPGFGPDILASGPPITRLGRHCHFLGGVADTVEDAVAAVRERAARGCDLVKVMATGGMGEDPNEALYTQTQLTRIVEAAHAEGLPVTVHAHAATGITNAVAAGVDSIEHCTFMTASGPRADERAVAEIAAKGIFVGATVAKPRADMPTAVLETLEPYWANHAYMHRQGVQVVCCTDAGINPVKTHDVLPRDMAFFASRVCGNTETLVSATARAAAACGIGDRKGRIATGWDADLLAVDGDPVDDIECLQHVSGVYRGGLRVG